MNKLGFKLLILGIIISFSACEKEEEVKVNELSVTPASLEFDEEGGEKNFTIETDAASWNIVNGASEWLTLSRTSDETSKALIVASVNSRTLTPHKDTLTITAGTAEPVYVIVSQASSEYLYTLSTNRIYANFAYTSGSQTMEVSSDAPAWTLTSDAGWVTFSVSEGTAGTTTTSIIVEKNSETSERSATVTLSGDGAPTTEIPVTQKGGYPDYNTSPLAPDETGMTSTAAELAAKMTIGWNIGNTLEAMGGETAWGNPLITKELIQFVKASGFNAIRIPCSYYQHMEDPNTAKIKVEWLDRVKEVIQYCVDEDLYVMLNIHWDGGWLENNVNPASREANNEMQKAFWSQIATHMRDFDEHLMFASANEPNVETATQMSVLNSYHQTFIDAVRATGGKNTYRVLIVQGPGTDIGRTNTLMNTLPYDEIPNKMMVEVHYYTPWNFCGLTEDASWGKMFYYWGEGYHSATDTERNATDGEENTVINLFGQMKTKFVSKGIPVILGEYGAIRRTTLTGDALQEHLDSRAYYGYYVTKQAVANGLIPFYWDEGSMSENGFGVINRTNNSVYDQQMLDSLIKGANELPTIY